MTFQQTVKSLLEQALAEKPSLFLIDLKISESYKITVILDGDQGVTLQDCVDVSRAIEHNIDREQHDFALEVMSAGISSPLKQIRQYTKNIGRNLAIKTEGQELKGKLIAVNDPFIELEWKARQPKKVGKGNETILKTEQININNIKEATVILSF